jgi:hypothetical protein
MAESFHEYRHVRNVPGEPRLRWFLSDYFELFVWFEEGDTPIAFRLCYDRGYQERAITWQRSTGHVRHDAVDSGGSFESYDASPILVTDRHSIPSRVIERFKRTPGEIPTEIRQLVTERLSAALSNS